MLSTNMTIQHLRSQSDTSSKLRASYGSKLKTIHSKRGTMWTRRFLTCGTLAREPEPPHASPRAHPLACPRWALSGLAMCCVGSEHRRLSRPSGYRVIITNVRNCSLHKPSSQASPRFCTSCNLDVSDIGTRGGRGWTISFLKLEFADFHVFHDVSHLHR